MSFVCGDLENALREDDGERLAAAAVHATTCPECREQLETWHEVSAAATALRRSWDSPGLWPRIQESLALEARHRVDRGRNRRRAAAGLLAAAAALIVALGAWRTLRPVGPGAPPEADAARQLLTERALEAVERSEADYVASIDRLAAVAEPVLREPHTPVLLAYREKLQVLDAAIAECRAHIEANRFNAHLRRELLSIYRDKQQTLEDLMEQERHAI